MLFPSLSFFSCLRPAGFPNFVPPTQLTFSLSRPRALTRTVRLSYPLGNEVTFLTLRVPTVRQEMRFPDGLEKDMQEAVHARGLSGSHIEPGEYQQPLLSLDFVSLHPRAHKFVFC